MSIEDDPPGASSAERHVAILIVEDEVLTRMAISDHLQEAGFKTFEATNAAEALEIIDSDRRPIDLVFTDVGLPGPMDGIGLARWIRLNRPHLPVVLTSGDARKAETARELCANGFFFHKPYDFEHLEAHIRGALRNGMSEET